MFAALVVASQSAHVHVTYNEQRCIGNAVGHLTTNGGRLFSRLTPGNDEGAGEYYNFT